ncbi:piggyBac transposable element-derived protein 4 [Trichonephila clavipes]|nr:piggyBac transposable element-derived protein 4 [Trichonephila clavipes]
MFMLCESHSGYVWSIIVYVGKGTDVSDENKECSFSTQVVLTLSKPLLNKGYCLTMDNYYNSPELGEMLLKSKTDFFGTLRPNRKDLPKELKTEKLKKETYLPIKEWLVTQATVPLDLSSNPLESIDVCKCIVPSRRRGTLSLKSSREIDGSKDRWEAPDSLQGVLSQNWGRIEPNPTITCMVLKHLAKDRRT